MMMFSSAPGLQAMTELTRLQRGNQFAGETSLQNKTLPLADRAKKKNQQNETSALVLLLIITL